MTIEQIKAYLKANKITYQTLSEKSEIPIGTLKNIFSKCSINPRLDTMQAIENALGLGLTPEEREAGAADTKKISLSAEEYELIMFYREIGRKHGAEAQKALITVAEKML